MVDIGSAPPPPGIQYWSYIYIQSIPAIPTCVIKEFSYINLQVSYEYEKDVIWLITFVIGF